MGKRDPRTLWLPRGLSFVSTRYVESKTATRGHYVDMRIHIIADPRTDYTRSLRDNVPALCATLPPILWEHVSQRGRPDMDICKVCLARAVEMDAAPVVAPSRPHGF